MIKIPVPGGFGGFAADGFFFRTIRIEPSLETDFAGQVYVIYLQKLSFFSPSGEKGYMFIKMGKLGHRKDANI